MGTAIASKGDISAIREDIHRVERRMDTMDGEIRLMKWMLGLSLAGSAGMLTLLMKLVMHG